MKIKATAQQCEQLYNARTSPNRKALKKNVFKAIKSQYGLSSAKLGVRNITNPDSPMYGVLYNTSNKTDLDDGKPMPVKVAPVATKTATTPVSKPVAKVVSKPVVKPVAAVKSIVGMPGISPVKTAKHQIEIRLTIDGARKRFGYASSEKAKAAAIAVLKA